MSSFHLPFVCLLSLQPQKLPASPPLSKLPATSNLELHSSLLKLHSLELHSLLLLLELHASMLLLLLELHSLPLLLELHLSLLLLELRSLPVTVLHIMLHLMLEL
jgi:hypothetical protein